MANRFRFAAIALATALPIVIFAVVVTIIFFRHERRTIEHALIQAAGNAAQLVDSQIASELSALRMVEGIVASVPNSTKPLQFQIMAEPALRQHPEWLALALTNADGTERLIEVRRSQQGVVIDHTPRPEPPLDRPAAPMGRAAHPSVGDVLMADGFEEPSVVMRVPVLENGKPVFIVAAVVRAWHFSEALKGQNLPDSWFSSLLDRENRVVARSRAATESDPMIGRKVSTPLRETIDGPSRLVPVTTLDGIEASVVAQRSARSDWVVAVGAPAEDMERLQQGTVFAVALGAFVTGVAAFAMLVATGRAASRQEAEERQRESDRRVAHIASQFPGVMYRRVLHPDGRISYTYISNGIHRLLGLPDGEESAPISMEDFARRHIHPEDADRWREAILKSAASLTPYDEEGRLIDAHGKARWVRTAARPHREPNGAVVWDGFILDITKLKTTEQQLRRSLDEKVTLLREVHHRVKNNLQAIWGLIQVESSRLKDIPRARERLDVLGQRIAVLGRIHHQLYASDLLTEVDMAAQIRQLCERLQDLTESRRVRFALELEPLVCDIETAVPLSLIVNELVSNALKHAFPAERIGAIRVSLRRDGSFVILVVEDNGVGTATETLEGGQGVGMMLVRALAGQMDATLNYGCQTGCRVELTIPGSRFRALEPEGRGSA